MEVRHLKPTDYKVSEWSGGKTTELFLYPATASYAERNFDVRFSSATVELEESDFTPLANYARVIMSLNGTLTLSHDGGEKISLPPFTSHSFGGWQQTHSCGKVTDFNVMTKRGEGVGEILPLQKTGEWHSAKGTALLLFYSYHSAARLTVCGKTYELRPMESCLIRTDAEECHGNYETDGTLILAQARFVEKE